LISKKYFYILLIVFLLLNFVFIINLNDFIFLGSSKFSDIPITHYPNLILIQNSIKQYQQFPLWSNLIFSGYPFSANPLSGLWYFPGWIALSMPLPAGINISLLLHLLIGLFGMFYFLRSLRISEAASLFGSIALFFSVKLYAHIGAGHLSYIYAICWTPWLLFFSIKYLQNKSYKNIIISGLFWGLILLADLRWSIPAFFIWFFVLLDERLNFRQSLKFISASLLIGLGSSIATWLPLLEFLRLSSRASLLPSELMVYSMSIRDFINLIFPIFEGAAEFRVYPGAAISLLFVLGIFLTKQNKPIRKWYLLAFVSIILSFGDNIPGMNLIYEIPGFSVMRVPSRFLFLMIFSSSIISSFVLDIIINQKISYSFKRIFFLVPILFFVILFSIGSIFIGKILSFNTIWPIIVFSGSFIFIQLILTKRFNSIRIGIGIIVLLVLDLLIVNIMSLTFLNKGDLINRNQEIIENLSKLPINFRVYTPSYSIPQEQGAFWNINQINGVDPMQLKDYVEYFVEVSGIPSEKYSVTLPPFKNGNPVLDNYGICPEKNSLLDLNTKYVISSFEMSKCNLGEELKINNQYLYDLGGNDNYVKFIDCESTNTSYNLIKYSPNEILLDINSCGGLMRLSEINYPGWNVYIDGVKEPLIKGSLFREFNVSEGFHTIHLKFQPFLVFISVGIQSFFWISGIFIIILLKRIENAKDLD
jgi:hypothetical protein